MRLASFSVLRGHLGFFVSCLFSWSLPLFLLYWLSFSYGFVRINYIFYKLLFCWLNVLLFYSLHLAFSLHCVYYGIVFVYFLNPHWGYIYCFQREREREREKHQCERNIDQFSPLCGWTGDQAQNLGVCPDQEFNLPSFGLWDNTPTNWATLKF